MWAIYEFLYRYNSRNYIQSIALIINIKVNVSVVFCFPPPTPPLARSRLRRCNETEVLPTAVSSPRTLYTYQRFSHANAHEYVQAQFLVWELIKDRNFAAITQYYIETFMEGHTFHLRHNTADITAFVYRSMIKPKH